MLQHNALETAAYDESVRLLLELHRLNLHGNDQSEAADAIRDAMEAPWWRLDSRQQKLLRGLSADLYSIGMERPVRSSPSDDGPAAFSNAVEARNWDEALQILRKHEAEHEGANLACLRGICWAKLDKPQVAALFFAEAVRICPDDPRFRHLHCRALVQANLLEEASEQAELAVDRSDNPYLLLVGADALLDCALMREGATQGDELENVLEIIARATRALKTVPQDEWRRDLFRASQLNRAICYDVLGNRQHAEEAAAEARAMASSDLDNLGRQISANEASEPEYSRQDLENRRDDIHARMFCSAA